MKSRVFIVAAAALLSASGISEAFVMPRPTKTNMIGAGGSRLLIASSTSAIAVDDRVPEPEDTAKRSGHFFRLSPKIHAASVALWMSLVGLLSFKPAAQLAYSALSALPCASWEPLEFHPLSPLNWAVHLVLVAFSLELPAAFFTLMRQSNDVQKKRAHKGFFAAYSLAYIHSMTTSLSHAFIGANTALECSLDNWFTALLRTFIFGTGLSVSLGPWTLLPVFIGVNLGVIGYGNWVGRGLATYTIYKHLSSEEHPSLFKLSFICLNLVPVADLVLLIKKDGRLYTDINHTLVAAALAIISGGMAFSLNQKANLGESIM